MPEPSASEVERAIEELKRHKSPGTDQIPTEFLKYGLGQFALRSIQVKEKSGWHCDSYLYIFILLCHNKVLSCNGTIYE